MTLLDFKTIRFAIRGLLELGLITPTGEHRGKSGRIPVYRLNLDAGNASENGAIKESSNASENGSIRTGNAAGSVTETHPDFPPNGAVSPSECDQKRMDQMAPETVHRTRKYSSEPGSEPGEKGEPCRAAGAPVAPLPGAAPSKPDPEERGDGNGNGAQQELAQQLYRWASEHGMTRKTGEQASAWRTRIRLERIRLELARVRSC